LSIPRTYSRLTRPRHWLFPGRDESKPIDAQVLYAACRSACAAAGLTKRVTVRTRATSKGLKSRDHCLGSVFPTMQRA